MLLEENNDWTCDAVTNAIITDGVDVEYNIGFPIIPDCWPENILIDHDERLIEGITEEQKEIVRAGLDGTGKYQPWISILREIILFWKLDAAICAIEANKKNVVESYTGTSISHGSSQHGQLSASEGVPTQFSTPFTVPLSGISRETDTCVNLRFRSSCVLDDTQGAQSTTSYRLMIDVDGFEFNEARGDVGNYGAGEQNSSGNISKLFQIDDPSGIPSVSGVINVTAIVTGTAATFTSDFWDATVKIDIVETFA